MIFLKIFISILRYEGKSEGIMFYLSNYSSKLVI